MTPAVVQLMQRLAAGETVACLNQHDSFDSIYLRIGSDGRLEFLHTKARYQNWNDAGDFTINSLVRFANQAQPPEPAQPKRQVRAVDLTE